MNLFKYLAANYFHLIGGMIVGLSAPIGPSIFGSRSLDMIILIPVGILLIGISVYYNFIHKYK